MGKEFEVQNVSTLTNFQRIELAKKFNIDVNAEPNYLTQKISEYLNGTIRAAQERLDEKQDEYQRAKITCDNSYTVQYYAEQRYETIKASCSDENSPELLAARTDVDAAKKSYVYADIDRSGLLNSVRIRNDYLRKMRLSLVLMA